MMILILFLLAITHSAESGFPYGRCYVRSCDSSPYQWTVTDDQIGKFCVQVTGKTCNETHPTYKCCGLFTQNLHKIVFPTRCNKSLDYVTVNNVRKSGGVFLDTYSTHNELRVTTLRLDATTAQGMVICVYLKKGIDCPKFCEDDDGLCKITVFDPAGHTCCPTCILDSLGALTSPAPPPLPGSTRPPLRSPAPSPSPAAKAPSPPPPVQSPPVQSPPMPRIQDNMLFSNMTCSCSCACSPQSTS